MRFGIFQSAQWPEGSSQQQRLQDAIEQSVLAEELGFDSVFMTEHHFTRHGIVPDSLAMLSYIAARTERIRLGTAVSVLPLHDPVRLAESAALFDVLSGGRFEFGIGRGYQWGEFDGFARSLDDRVTRFDECIGVILRAWAEDGPFTHDGQYWQYRNAHPQPQPLQKPHPPIWMATVSEDGFDLCVEHGWGVMMPQAVPLEIVEKWVSAYRAAFERHGKPFDVSKLILARGLHVGKDDDSAVAEFGPPYHEFLELAKKVAESPHGNASPMPFGAEGLNDTAVLGGPERCIERLQAIRELGIEYVIFFSNMGGLEHRLVMESLRRFSVSVMPQFRDA